MIYETEKISRKKLWSYVNDYIPGYRHIFFRRDNDHYLHVDNRFIRINHSSFREVFFVKIVLVGQEYQLFRKEVRLYSRVAWEFLIVAPGL
jgi:hypothetical protein